MTARDPLKDALDRIYAKYGSNLAAFFRDVQDTLKEVMPTDTLPTDSGTKGVSVTSAPAPQDDAGADEFAEMARKVAESWVCVGNGTKTGLRGMIECALRSAADKRTRECVEIAKAARLAETGPDFFSVSTQRKEMARGIEDEIRRRYPEAFRESQ